MSNNHAVTWRDFIDHAKILILTSVLYGSIKNSQELLYITDRVNAPLPWEIDVDELVKVHCNFIHRLHRTTIPARKQLNTTFNFAIKLAAFTRATGASLVSKRALNTRVACTTAPRPYKYGFCVWQIDSISLARTAQQHSHSRVGYLSHLERWWASSTMSVLWGNTVSFEFLIQKLKFKYVGDT